MSHFSPKTKAANSVITTMRVMLQRYKGDATEQTKRLDTLEELVNYTIAKEVELNESQENYAKALMKIGELQSKIKELGRQYHISEQVNERGVEEVVNDFMQRFECEVLKV
jgi:hypothetical protein